MIVIFDCKEHRNSDYQIDRILLHSPAVNVFSKSCKVKTGIRLQMVTYVVSIYYHLGWLKDHQQFSNKAPILEV